MDGDAISEFVNALYRAAGEVKTAELLPDGFTKEDYFVFVVMGCLSFGTALRGANISVVCSDILRECGKSEAIKKIIEKCEQLVENEG
jgi:hypothetical protein